MFHHVKELQFDARVSKPDPRFAALLLEQFGGGNGELKAAMQYFVQAFSARQPYPEKYDLLMDIATEEFSHLEIVGATITMLLDGVNGELKNAAEANPITKLNGKSSKENLIHEALVNPQFLTLSGGGPTLTNSQGVPWTGAYVDANGDLTVDLRSDIAAESRAKIVYEYLLQFTDDPHVKDTLRFLMTREIAHFQMFSAALETIQPNFPPGVLQGDPRFTHEYFNMSNGVDARGPWNEGQGPWGDGEHWEYIEDPIKHVVDTQGEINHKPEGTNRSAKEVARMDKEMSKQRSEEVRSRLPKGENQWSSYPQTELASPRSK
ncbi:manganese catalase family protein [Sinorhizobium medicae]|uniref:Manganese catalase family protein n=1 Tax=Sinorhizobium medicae TaxID=110321 RepID=A0A6G1WV23_9HYPH|nr:manganese catalase family protein [Sinorhizobium medicae]MQW00448.1 manganese catalase family protein [Sinorhizobium medicae]MQW73608.1 manganese catalase family protein [Sinorhizobium medicae]MQX45669.1 manganese catalase family protein [Sinorhizobium medicae]MQX87740.1 manganese catalase family protein [Sinorhizobium medicae]MQX95833.1 manganese catalase family protein [Sinorhizobium medicae]